MEVEYKAGEGQVEILLRRQRLLCSSQPAVVNSKGSTPAKGSEINGYCFIQMGNQEGNNSDLIAKLNLRIYKSTLNDALASLLHD